MRNFLPVLLLLFASCSEVETSHVPEESSMSKVTLNFVVNPDRIVRSAYGDYTDVCFTPQPGDAYYDENPDLNFAPPRELVSENFWQQANCVNIYVYKLTDGEFRYTGTSYAVTEFGLKFDALGATSTWCGTDRQPNETNSITVSAYYEAGQYKFLATALDDPNALTLAPSIGQPLTELVASSAEVATTEFFWQIASNPADGSDVFAIGPNTPSLSINFSGLSRGVAGLLFYVENIPATKAGRPVTSIGVTASVATTYTTLNGYGEPGFTSETCIMNRSLELFVEEDGYLVRPTAYSERHPNALLMGAFVIPQASTSLSLVYYTTDEDSGEPVAIHRIPIRPSQEKTTELPLEANHLYTVGTKKYTPDGKGFANPDTDDLPFDLRLNDGTAPIVLHVCPYYEASHNITIN